MEYNHGNWKEKGFFFNNKEQYKLGKSGAIDVKGMDGSILEIKTSH